MSEATVLLEDLGGVKHFYPVESGRVWVSDCSSIALSDLSFHEFTKVGQRSFRRCYEDRHDGSYDDADWKGGHNG